MYAFGIVVAATGVLELKPAHTARHVVAALRLEGFGLAHFAEEHRRAKLVSYLFPESLFARLKWVPSFSALETDSCGALRTLDLCRFERVRSYNSSAAWFDTVSRHKVFFFAGEFFKFRCQLLVYAYDSLDDLQIHRL
jgi:hypothetical protein